MEKGNDGEGKTRAICGYDTSIDCLIWEKRQALLVVWTWSLSSVVEWQGSVEPFEMNYNLATKLRFETSVLVNVARSYA